MSDQGICLDYLDILIAIVVSCSRLNFFLCLELGIYFFVSVTLDYMVLFQLEQAKSNQMIRVSCFFFLNFGCFPFNKYCVFRNFVCSLRWQNQTSCADPESSVRGGPTLTTVFFS